MVREISLNQGKVTLVDDEDYPRVAEFKWTALNTGSRSRVKEFWYVYRNIRVDGQDFRIALHRFILGVPDGVTVDHIDGDPLNNQKSNLRMASKRQQTWNRQKRIDGTNLYKGVTERKDGRYVVLIGHEGKRRYLGAFRTAEEAAKVFDAAARMLHGEFAWTNFATIDPDAETYVQRVLVDGFPPARQRPRAIFTTQQIAQIRAEYGAGGVTQQALADRHGCHISTINRVIRENRYQHDVPDELIGMTA